ncbi:VOC family protein [Shewanella xiamenensis]|uniref:VOC family protein n=1 Tax=Shewanella xiamenensis TaxID=332186 RepID=UPI001C4F5B42|nr:VOC family protein [Shewanella xiamenensis]MBW0279643.1 glyoxalase [Shewanella xiamenensis]MCT8871846.1 VOC family protein [Shewanella xiamenensis]UWH42279.1 VOC family protein [Shewanella xiamenensis]
MRITQYAQGQACWVELASHDWQGAQGFYHALFGWNAVEMAIPNGHFSLFNLEGDDLGAMYQIPESEPQIPSHWRIYFAVKDIEATVAAILAAGGQLHMGPHVVGDAGVMAQVSDPEGARFALWQAKNHSGSRRQGEENTLCWVELACREPSAEASFYTQVFPWAALPSHVPGIDYTEWQIDGQSMGGMMKMMPEWGEIPAHWMPYFVVADCDAFAVKAQGLGAQLCVPPSDIPDVGRFAVIADAQGATFAVIHLSQNENQ